MQENRFAHICHYILTELYKLMLDVLRHTSGGVIGALCLIPLYDTCLRCISRYASAENVHRINR
jgi:hypothetical protein